MTINIFILLKILCSNLDISYLRINLSFFFFNINFFNSISSTSKYLIIYSIIFPTAVEYRNLSYDLDTNLKRVSFSVELNISLIYESL